MHRFYHLVPELLTPGQKVPFQAQGLEHLPCSPDFLLPNLFLFHLKIVLNRQQFSSTKEITAKVIGALTELSINAFQECF
jgi:hypothetical protein